MVGVAPGAPVPGAPGTSLSSVLELVAAASRRKTITLTVSVGQQNTETGLIKGSVGGQESAPTNKRQLTYSVVGQPTNGTVVINPTTGEFTYTAKFDWAHNQG